VHDPEYLFGVFQNLVRNNNVHALIAKWKRVVLQPMRMSHDPQLAQFLNVWQMPLQCEELRLIRPGTSNKEVSSAAGSDIQDRLIRSRHFQETPDNVAPVIK
jgi:hypothetical protein